MIELLSKLPQQFQSVENLLSLIKARVDDDDNTPEIIVTLFLGLREDQRTQLTFNILTLYHSYIKDVVKLIDNDGLRLGDREQLYYYLKRVIENSMNTVKH